MNKNTNKYRNIEAYLAGITIFCFIAFLVLPYSIKNYYNDNLYSITSKILSDSQKTKNSKNIKEDFTAFILNILN